MWTPERIALLIGALVPLLLATGGGVAWLVNFIFTRLDKRTAKTAKAPPEPTPGIPVDNFADDAIEALKVVAAERLRQIKSTEKRLERANNRLGELGEHPY